jgi:hypothetical protein
MAGWNSGLSRTIIVVRVTRRLRCTDLPLYIFRTMGNGDHILRYPPRFIKSRIPTRDFEFLYLLVLRTISSFVTVDERGGLRIFNYLRWAELNIYMTVHELSLTRTKQSGQGPNRYIFELEVKLSLLQILYHHRTNMTRTPSLAQFFVRTEV